LGIAQRQLASYAMEQERNSARLAESIQSLEGVDPYEAATRMNSLLTQLEASYAVTARISRLTLLSFI
jgi:flagellar hook-associated protein 3 FlgL